MKHPFDGFTLLLATEEAAVARCVHGPALERARAKTQRAMEFRNLYRCERGRE